MFDTRNNCFSANDVIQYVLLKQDDQKKFSYWLIVLISEKKLLAAVRSVESIFSSF